MRFVRFGHPLLWMVFKLNVSIVSFSCNGRLAYDFFFNPSFRMVLIELNLQICMISNKSIKLGSDYLVGKNVVRKSTL